MRIKMTALLLFLVVALGLCGRAFATEAPDPNRLGSISFEMEFDGTPLEDGSLTLYRVGQLAPEGNAFTLVEPLQQNGPSLDDLWDPRLAEDLYILAEVHDLEPRTAAIENGLAAFRDLEPGLYVVCQRPGGESSGYAAIDPFLISLPQWKNGSYVYDLTAAPKVPLVPAPTETTEPTEPTETTPPRLPQTGQLNWPVPLMAVLGLAFFGLGWSLFFGAKRRNV